MQGPPGTRTSARAGPRTGQGQRWGLSGTSVSIRTGQLCAPASVFSPCTGLCPLTPGPTSRADPPECAAGPATEDRRGRLELPPVTEPAHPVLESRDSPENTELLYPAVPEASLKVTQASSFVSVCAASASVSLGFCGWPPHLLCYRGAGTAPGALQSPPSGSLCRNPPLWRPGMRQVKRLVCSLMLAPVGSRCSQCQKAHGTWLLEASVTA